MIRGKYIFLGVCEISKTLDIYDFVTLHQVKSGWFITEYLLLYQVFFHWHQKMCKPTNKWSCCSSCWWKRTFNTHCIYFASRVSKKLKISFLSRNMKVTKLYLNIFSLQLSVHWWAVSLPASTKTFRER